jgi:hypothetical protein
MLPYTLPLRYKLVKKYSICTLVLYLDRALDLHEASRGLFKNCIWLSYLFFGLIPRLNMLWIRIRPKFRIHIWPKFAEPYPANVSDPDPAKAPEPCRSFSDLMITWKHEKLLRKYIRRLVVWEMVAFGEWSHFSCFEDWSLGDSSFGEWTVYQKI